MPHKIIKTLMIYASFLILSSGDTKLFASGNRDVDANTLDYGAVRDGVTDCTNAFQKTSDSIKKDGGIVYAPAGRYKFRSHLLIPSGATLTSSWQGPPTRESGTMLLITEGAKIRTAMHSSRLKGILASLDLITGRH